MFITLHSRESDYSYVLDSVLGVAEVKIREDALRGKRVES
jgi:hypothetical protein